MDPEPNGPEQPTDQPGADLVVAVLTYKRTEDILELVPMLVAQAATVAAAVRVLVVDNDPDGGAREPVEALVAGRSLPGVRYVHEPRPGIAHGRNRALDESVDADLLVFVDDDERPEDGWLSALVDCQRSTGAAAVAGAVVPAHELVADPWIEAGGFFVRQRHPSGSPLPAASTANLLLDLRQLRALGDLRFDVRFGTTGGSDTLFTRQLVQRGGRIVWCDEAVVVDYIRSARVTRDWVLQRAYRSGNSWSRCEVEITEGSAARLRVRGRLLLVGLARVVAGVLRLVLGQVSRSLRHQARGRRTVSRGLGMAAGAAGRVYGDAEYRRAPGGSAGPGGGT